MIRELKVSLSPTKYMPHFALDWATHLLFNKFRNPILPCGFDLTRDTIMYWFSSPLDNKIQGEK